MNILLTGANGFLGRIISNELKFKNNLFTAGRLKGDYIFDLNSDNYFFDQKFDLVIHSAGKAHNIPKTQNEITEFFNVNINGTKNLLNSLVKQPPKQFLFISSISVYGLLSGKNINEDFELLAEDPYGKSKIEAEKIIKSRCVENNVICTIFRLPLIIGENPPGNLGSMLEGIKKGYYFNIGGGNAKKSMVLASDVAQCILKVSGIGGIYNLTDGYHPTFNELSRTISLQLGRNFVPNMPLVFAKALAKIGDLIGDMFPINSNRLSKIMAPLTFNDTKARKAFGWNPTPVLKGFKI